jgi:2-phosphoglycerate kinase
METGNKYVSLDDLSDKEFYKKVKGEKFNEPYDFGFLALDRQQRIVTIEVNPERAKALAISLGCEHPRVVGADELSKKFYKQHNKKLERALSD